MKFRPLLRPFRWLWRAFRVLVVLAGIAAIVLAASLFTGLPYRAYRHMAALPPGIPEAPAEQPPTHIFLPSGGGIPSESGLMRTYAAAAQAAAFPDARLLLAVPGESDARAYIAELALRGVSPDRITLLPGINTRTQVRSILEALPPRTPGAPLPVVLVVTSPEHIRRTAATLHRIAPRLPVRAAPAWAESLSHGDAEYVSPVAAAAAGLPPHTIRYSCWNNLRYLSDAARETLALAWYRLLRWA